MNKQLFDLSEKLQEKLNWDGPEVDRYIRFHKPQNEYYPVNRAEYDNDSKLFAKSPTAKQFDEENEVVRLYEKDFLLHKLPNEIKPGFVLTLQRVSDSESIVAYAKGDRMIFAHSGETDEEALLSLALGLKKSNKL